MLESLFKRNVHTLELKKMVDSMMVNLDQPGSRLMFCGSIRVGRGVFSSLQRCGQTAGLDAFSLGNVIKQAGFFCWGTGVVNTQARLKQMWNMFFQ